MIYIWNSFRHTELWKWFDKTKKEKESLSNIVSEYGQKTYSISNHSVNQDISVNERINKNRFIIHMNKF